MKKTQKSQERFAHHQGKTALSISGATRNQGIKKPEVEIFLKKNLELVKSAGWDSYKVKFYREAGYTWTGREILGNMYVAAVGTQKGFAFVFGVSGICPQIFPGSCSICKIGRLNSQ